MASAHSAAAASQTADAIRSRLALDGVPDLAIVLGSGLGGLARRLEGARELPYQDVPGFRVPRVAGHTGALLVGELEGHGVVILSGRFHLYEGHDAPLAGFPIRVAHALGARTILVSNAAGGIRPTLRAGDLLLIRDHINLTFRNPLVGRLEPGDERFPDMSEPYDRALSELAKRAALEVGVTLQEGVYAGLLGPSYETPAEIRMLARLGADVVGMSTVPEVITARALGMRVTGISCVTNVASGLSGQALTHQEVLAAGAEASGRFEAVVQRFVRLLARVATR